MDFYQKNTETPYSFLVIDNNLASDSPFLFRKNILEMI